MAHAAVDRGTAPPVPSDRRTRRDLRRDTRRGRWSNLAPWAVVVVPVVVALVGAWLYRWVDEDAFIDFRVVGNLLAGHGPVYNLSERVEVYSDPLWIAALSALRGILRFISVEWLSVLLGLASTAGGMLLGGRAIQRLAKSRGEGLVLPLGLLVLSVVAGVWEFVTAGLEMGMVFLWAGLFFWLLVRLEQQRRAAGWCAVVAGLGALVRPELALVAAVDLVAVLVVVALPGWRGPTGVVRRFVAPVVLGVALPALYELFRMAYFGLIEPNTGLAKAAGASWWSQGFTYLWNFVAPYTLWLPLLVGVVLCAPMYLRWFRRKDRGALVVVATPVAGALVDLAYVAHLGGDYMHARLVLPAFFSLCLVLAVSVAALRGLAAIGLGAVVVWALICAGWLRYVPPKGSFSSSVVFISNERDNWVQATGRANPVTAGDYARALSGRAGNLLHRLAAEVPSGRQVLIAVTNPYAPISGSAERAARSRLPFTLAVNVPAIGVIGYVSGPRVYIFDSFSLANPIGSHTTVVGHARPGHEKPIGPAWMVARFGIPGEPLPPGAPSQAEVASARRALGCDPLRSYLSAITSPMGFGRAWSDFTHAVGWTSMSFSATPSRAAAQLCGK